MTGIIHVEDDPLWVDFVAKEVARLPGVHLHGSATTGTEGLLRTQLLKPAIVILDLRLPDANGVRLIDSFTECNPAPRLLLLTARADEAALARAFHDPVLGMLWKLPGAGEQLRQAIVTILNGGHWYAPEVLSAWRRFHAAPNAYIKMLTVTELRLLPLFAEGRTDHEVAALDGCRESTAHTHRRNIMAKLALHSHKELQAWALARGIYEPMRAAPPCGATWFEC